MKKKSRVMIKLSGEVLAGSAGTGVDAKAIEFLIKEIKSLTAKKIEVAIVVGGGNFWRFRDNSRLKIPREASDTIGMMATFMNARFLQEALRAAGVEAHALAPHGNFYFVEPYSPSRAKELLSRKSVVICGGGTGNPYFTTDTAATLRALELDCDVLLKATKVDGVYDSDPMKNKNAKPFAKITYDEFLKRRLQVMDQSAVLLAKENSLPIRVFKGSQAGLLLKAAQSKNIGSLIY